MTDSLVDKAESDDLSKFFRLDLFWSAPDHEPIQVDLEDGRRITAQNVSSYKGVRVWEVPTVPDSAVEAQLDHAVAKNSTNRLVIFRDSDKQVWRWPSRSARGGGVISRAARHVHKVGSADPQFEAKLEAIRLPTDVQVDVNELLARVRGAFDVETKNETKRASKLMAQMYAAVEKGYAPAIDAKTRDHEISVTLARVLFLLFGDDTEMWKSPSDEPLPDLFQDFVKDHTSRDGSDIAARLNALFEVLNRAPADRNGFPEELVGFPYVNGGIFHEQITLPQLDDDFRRAILEASAVDWSAISPAIFGSMFQSVRDAQTRRELGEHYTSEENILKTLNPLFLDELRAEFGAALRRDTPQKQINALNALWKKLGEIRFMDPACGCGNFIIVAYRELRDLELAIMGALADLQQGTDAAALDADWTHLLKVSLDHFFGIEIDEWPARIAETAMFLIDRQADLKMKERFGVAPERLPIQKSAKIVVGDALEVSWPTIVPPSGDVIVAGNPPFLGHISRTALQTEQLRAAWDGADIGRLDYVTAWYATAMRYYGSLPGRWAFVSTNSVTQGDQVPRLFGPVFRGGWRIKFAHRTFAWASEASGAAAVHCNIIGFHRENCAARLFDYKDPWSQPQEVEASSINGYLVDGPNVLISPRSEPLSTDIAPVTFGNMPRDGGNLVVEVDAYPSVIADKVAAKYVRPFLGSEELVRGGQRWCLWMTTLDPADVERSPVLRERIEGVRAMRLQSKAGSTKGMAATPHLFGQRAAEMRDSYLAIPAVVSESRPYYTAARLPAEAIASNKLYVVADADGFLFGVVSSSMFLTWQFTVGNRLESRPSFSNTLVWNNFPLPEIDEVVRGDVIGAGRKVIAAREAHPGKSLAALYEPRAMPVDLASAHAELDVVVDRIFGLGSSVPGMEERQSALFESYVKIDAGLLAEIKSAAPTRRRTRRA